MVKIKYILSLFVILCIGGQANAQLSTVTGLVGGSGNTTAPQEDADLAVISADGTSSTALSSTSSNGGGDSTPSLSLPNISLDGMSSGGSGAISGGGGAAITDSSLNSSLSTQKDEESQMLSDSIQKFTDLYKNITSLGSFTGGLTTGIDVYPDTGESATIKNEMQGTATSSDAAASDATTVATSVPSTVDASDAYSNYPLPSLKEVKAFVDANITLPVDGTEIETESLKNIRTKLAKMKGIISTVGVAKAMVETTVSSRTLTTLKDDFDNKVNQVSTMRESIAINNDATGAVAEIYAKLVDSSAYKNALNAIENVEKTGSLSY